MNTEKVYITRDEGSDWIWVWRKPAKGNWSPVNIGKSEGYVNWQRQDRSLDGVSAYIAPNFKKKFGIQIRPKTKKCIHLPVQLLNSDDYQEFSNNSKRKR